MITLLKNYQFYLKTKISTTKKLITIYKKLLKINKNNIYKYIFKYNDVPSNNRSMQLMFGFW